MNSRLTSLHGSFSSINTDQPTKIVTRSQTRGGNRSLTPYCGVSGSPSSSERRASATRRRSRTSSSRHKGTGDMKTMPEGNKKQSQHSGDSTERQGATSAATATKDGKRKAKQTLRKDTNGNQEDEKGTRTAPSQDKNVNKQTKSHANGDMKTKSGRMGAKSTVALVAVLVVTVFSFYVLPIFPSVQNNEIKVSENDALNLANDDLHQRQDSVLRMSIWEKSAQVWWSGWLTAIATAMGTLPFLFVSNIAKYWLGVCNAGAAGMMLSASTGLAIEGLSTDVPELWGSSPAGRVLVGLILGLIFIIATKYFLGEYEDLKFGDAQGVDAKKALLVMVVMTVHSFSEGVAIGVSFGGDSGEKFGVFIATTLAVHNIPEGLATSLVLVPHKVPLIDAALWCIFTSLPQPIMAVPAFALVEYFLPILPIGLGFAAGAMVWVALFELLPEAKEDAGSLTTLVACMCAAAAMTGAQVFLR